MIPNPPPTWDAGVCPDCGQHSLFGYMLYNQHGRHMHTRYVCNFWAYTPDVPNQRCGWTGWSVPGWDKE